MRCPHCSATATTERSDRTAHGDRRFRCKGCGRPFSERTGSARNRLQVPTDVAFLIVLCRLRLTLSLRGLAEILLLRGLAFAHEAVREWEAQRAPWRTDAMRQRRKGKIGRSWSVDETSLTVGGRWCSLDRAIDRDGNLVDVCLSETRDPVAAEAVFRWAMAVTGIIPETMTSDKHTGDPAQAAWPRRAPTGDPCPEGRRLA